MNRGDTNAFSFKIYKIGTSPKEYVDGSQYTEVECQFNVEANFNSIKKLLSKDEVEWNATTQSFSCFLTQEDTFALPSGTSEVQVRLFVNDTCKGTAIYNIDINKCLSSEVLE